MENWWNKCLINQQKGSVWWIKFGNVIIVIRKIYELALIHQTSVTSIFHCLWYKNHQQIHYGT